MSLRAADSRRLDSADHFRLVAEHAPVMIWLAGPDRKCVYVNRTWLDFTGRGLDAETGSGWTERVHPDDREALLETYEEAFLARCPFEASFRLCRRDGAYRCLVSRGAPLLQHDRFIGFVASCSDDTERVLADERRDQFLAIMSHELRTPLNGIQSWAHVLENQLREADPLARRALTGIMTGVEQQVRLIDALLEMARAMSGNVGLAEQPLPLPGLTGTRRRESVGHSPNPEGAAMDNKQRIEQENRRTERMPKERPERGPDPDSLEGPGERNDANGEEDARNKVTRRGER